MVLPLAVEINLDPSVIPENFSNCKMIEFVPSDDEILIRDYLQLITISQGHIVDPSQLNVIYLQARRDLRKTITQLQFWCQFGVGDSRCGAEWINWDGNESDWVMSRGTYVNGIDWRQQSSAGEEVVLETAEDVFPNLDLEHLLLPNRIDDELMDSLSIFKRGNSVHAAIKGIEEFFDVMSYLDCTCDRQFTDYEVTPFVNPSPDDVLDKPVLRSHPGRRFEKPQGVEMRWSPSIRVLARKVLEKRLKDEGYRIPRLSAHDIYTRPLIDFVSPKP